MNAVVTAEYRATSEINVGDQNLARMHSLDLETNELKWGKMSCLDLSFIPQILEHTRTLPETGEIEPIVCEQVLPAREQ